MFDESTSAVDTKTEAIIYQLLYDLHIWFVTISHRPSLVKYHQKELKLHSHNIDNKETDPSLNNDDDVTIDLPIHQHFTPVRIDENIAGETQLVNISNNNNNTGYVEIIKSGSWFKEIKDIWKLIHLPFGPNDKFLRIQVNKTLHQYKNSFSFS